MKRFSANCIWVVLVVSVGVQTSAGYAEIIIDDFTVGPTNRHWDIVNGGNLHIQELGLPEANVWGGGRNIHVENVNGHEYVDIEIDSGTLVYSANLPPEELGLSYRSSMPIDISGENSAFAISFGDLGSNALRISLGVRDDQGAGQFAWVTGVENSTVVVPTSAFDSINDYELDPSSITLIALGLYGSPYVEVERIAFIPEPSNSRLLTIAVAVIIVSCRRRR
ncbi:MAG: hypothetical protein KDA87_22640 [Planctomycetales bacterium]|nr:hypothetical protein [Planctomycetales bacterium]